MAIDYSYKELSSRAKKRLQIIIHNLYVRPKTQRWRSQDIRDDLVLWGELFVMSQGNPKAINALWNLCDSEIEATLNELETTRQQHIGLNDPESIKRMLQLYPSLSPLFIDYVNNQAAIVEAENQLGAQNEQDTNMIMEAIIQSEIMREATQQEKYDTSIDPYKTFDVSPHASQTEVQTKCLKVLTEELANEGKSSDGFITAALATKRIGTQQRRNNYHSEKNVVTEKSEHTIGMNAPKPKPPVWE